MKNKLVAVVLIVCTVMKPTSTYADFWGGDIPLLIQIVTNTAQQLIKLGEIISTGRNQLQHLQDINRGINDSLGMIRTVYPDIDPGIYREWDKVQAALGGIEQIYGSVPKTGEEKVQRDTDQNVAEAIALNNSVYKYTRDIDEIGEAIKQYSHAVSPGGAQKLTAQSLGVILNVLNQSLRTQATGLKIQAQSLAIENRKDKEVSRKMMETSDALRANMRAQDTSYTLPRF
jgi:hypothetical protein